MPFTSLYYAILSLLIIITDRIDTYGDIPTYSVFCLRTIHPRNYLSRENVPKAYLWLFFWCENWRSALRDFFREETPTVLAEHHQKYWFTIFLSQHIRCLKWLRMVLIIVSWGNNLFGHCWHLLQGDQKKNCGINRDTDFSQQNF